MKNDFKICVIGLGYVGAPLLACLAQKYELCGGFDLNENRVIDLKNNIDITNELNSTELLSLNKSQLFTDENQLKNYNFYIVTVPTPVDSNNNPDLRALILSSETIGRYIDKNDIIVYESTVYPGVTEEVCVPAVEKTSNLKGGYDFYYGYSPERINPGDHSRRVADIKKVTSGCCAKSADIIDNVYSSVIKAGTYKATSVKVAEASKVIENAQRDINIAFFNELSIIFNKLQINTRDVIDAASTKWNFMKLYPGLVGGHCISVDPYYLIKKSIDSGYTPELLSNSRKINEEVPEFLVNLAFSKINNDTVGDTSVYVYGLSFKEDCPDTRNSKSFNVIDKISEHTNKIMIFDDLVKHTNNEDVLFKKLDLNDNVEIIFYLVNHHESSKHINEYISKNPKTIVIDLKSAIDKSLYGSNIISI